MCIRDSLDPPLKRPECRYHARRQRDQNDQNPLSHIAWLALHDVSAGLARANSLPPIWWVCLSHRDLMDARVGILQIIYTWRFYAGNQTLDSKEATTGKRLWLTARWINPAGIDAQASINFTTSSLRCWEIFPSYWFCIYFRTWYKCCRVSSSYFIGYFINE